MGSKSIKLISAVVFFFFIITTCKKDHGVTSFEITDVTVTGNTVKVTGKIISLSDTPVTAYGVCYSTKSNPVATDTVVNLGVPKVGAFSAEISGLKRNKTYYFKAYIKEGDNYLYDDVLSAVIAAIPPSGTSLAATGITEAAATLNGTVNPNGSGAVWSFEYGTTSAYGNTANAAQNTLAGEAASAVSLALSSLAANTTYHYRIKVTGPGGTVYGENMTFTTKINLVPPTIVSSGATGIANTAATLNASVNPNGSATKVSFEYGTTFMYGSSADASADSIRGFVPSAQNVSLSSLTPGQVYHYRVKAVSAGGTSYSQDAVFTTTRPPTVSTQNATSVTANGATLNGQVNANGLATTVTFEYGTTTSYGSAADASPASLSGTTNNQVNAVISGLSENTTYHYRVKAVSTAGTEYGSDISFTTTQLQVLPTITTVIPSMITKTTASSGGNITNAGTGTITGRGVCWNTTGSPTTSDTKTSDGTTAGFFASAVTGLTAGTQYYLRAYATSTAGTSYGDQAVFTTLTTDPLPPTVTTAAVTNITSASATGGGNVTADGGSEVAYRGVCYNTTGNPTIDDFKTINGTGTGIFSGTFSDLTPNTTYYVRAYATNMAGTSYGPQVSFTSAPPPAELPTVTTSAITGILSYSASSGGNVTADGGGAVTARGICWSTSEFPTVNDQKTVNGTGTGAFSSSLTSLAASTMYYVRAYATNSAGTAYGNELSFTTEAPPAGMPTLSTAAITGITSTSANGGGNITNDGGAAITARGICWNTVSPATLSNSFSTDGMGSGSFASFISGLAPNTKYYVRAYATNSAGTAYGNEVNFTTSLPDPILPTVTTATVISITHNSASGGGNVTSDGYATVTERGICWSLTENPTTDNSKGTSGTGPGTFTVPISSLTPSKTYYVRAYAINSVGTAYGPQVSFTTTAPPYVIPTLTTTAATGVTNNSASTGGTISSNGGDPITASGVCYGTTPSPTISGNILPNGATSGSFTSNLSSLSASTTYYVRAYATNAAGTAYGNEISFTTAAPPVAEPTVTTTDITGIGSTTASSGGNVTYGGTSAVTARGVCWSTTINPTIASSKTVDGSGTGAYSSSLAGLTPCTTYHVRAYATNSSGTVYGADLMFTTAAVLPSITTTTISGVTSTGASSGGNITGNCLTGGSGVTARGVCWNTTGSPTTSDPKTSNGTGGGSYTSTITGLTPCVKYYVRAYATNGAGTVYGSEVTFTTSTVAPSITTTAVSAITTTTATSGGTISGDCQASVTERGIVWSTLTNPTTALPTKTTSGTGGGSFTAGMTGLTPCTMYYVRAYVIITGVTFYGNQVAFTAGTELATLSTTAISGITSNSALTGGTVSGTCGGVVTSRGVCWSTSPGPTTSSPKLFNGSGSGSFSISISGLAYNTTYYVRSFAINSAGTVYGNEISFTTLPLPPQVYTTTPLAVSVRSTPSGGNITNDYGGPVTERGVCWNTTGSPTIANNVVTSGTGTGSYTIDFTSFSAGGTYYLRAYAINSGGVGYGSTVTVNVPSLVTDVDGNVYATVSISGYTWMQENLKVTKYNDGSGLTPYYDTASTFVPYYHTYANITSNGDTYGYLYNGFVVGGMKNICPTGWHIATTSDWSNLSSALGGSGVGGGKMKDLSGNLAKNKLGGIYFNYYYWNDAITGHSNDARFYARGGGYYTNIYTALQNSTRWWQSNRQYVQIDYNITTLTLSSAYGSDDNAFYIRCKKD